VGFVGFLREEIQTNSKLQEILQMIKMIRKREMRETSKEKEN